MNKIYLSKEVEEQVDFCVRYGSALDIDACFLRIKQRYLYNKKQRSEPADKDGKLKLWFDQYIFMVQRRYRYYENMRCPECGAKLTVRRCLGCDLKNGVAYEQRHSR